MSIHGSNSANNYYPLHKQCSNSHVQTSAGGAPQSICFNNNDTNNTNNFSHCGDHQLSCKSSSSCVVPQLLAPVSPVLPTTATPGSCLHQYTLSPRPSAVFKTVIALGDECDHPVQDGEDNVKGKSHASVPSELPERLGGTFHRKYKTVLELVDSGQIICTSHSLLYSTTNTEKQDQLVHQLAISQLPPSFCDQDLQLTATQTPAIQHRSLIQRFSSPRSDTNAPVSTYDALASNVSEGRGQQCLVACHDRVSTVNCSHSLHRHISNTSDYSSSSSCNNNYTLTHSGDNKVNSSCLGITTSHSSDTNKTINNNATNIRSVAPTVSSERQLRNSNSSFYSSSDSDYCSSSSDEDHCKNRKYRSSVPDRREHSISLNYLRPPLIVEPKVVTVNALGNDDQCCKKCNVLSECSKIESSHDNKRVEKYNLGANQICDEQTKLLLQLEHKSNDSWIKSYYSLGDRSNLKDSIKSLPCSTGGDAVLCSDCSGAEFCYRSMRRKRCLSAPLQSSQHEEGSIIEHDESLDCVTPLPSVERLNKLSRKTCHRLHRPQYKAVVVPTVKVLSFYQFPVSSKLLRHS